MDTYLIDGVKVLYNYAVALFTMFKKNIKAKQFDTGEELWTFLLQFRTSGNLDFQRLTEISRNLKQRYIL
jgi:hypothetical protein